MVLCFEAEVSISRARIWVSSYNQRSKLKLSINSELPNSLFVVQFDAEDLQGAKRALLAASPLGATDVFASVNDYTSAFDPCNQADFRHLVTVNIPQGNEEIFSIIHFITSIIGNYVKAVLGKDDKHISVIVETQLKLFPAHGQFQLQDSEMTKISFEYEGWNLWCCFCFSYGHIPARCRQPRPRLFTAPDLVLDVDLGIPPSAPTRPFLRTMQVQLDGRSQPNSGPPVTGIVLATGGPSAAGGIALATGGPSTASQS